MLLQPHLYPDFGNRIYGGLNQHELPYELTLKEARFRYSTIAGSAPSFQINGTGLEVLIFLQQQYQLEVFQTLDVFLQQQYSLARSENMTFAETFTLDDDMTNAGSTLSMGLTDTLQLSDAGTAYRKVAELILQEQLTLDDDVLVKGVFGLQLPESILFDDALRTNAQMLAYVVNANTAAVSRYQGYNFNSFAKINGKYFGASDAGIYLLDGDTDAGAPIEASVLTGHEDYGVTENKRIPVVYMGVTTTGQVRLSVTTDKGATRVYALKQKVAPLRTGRVELGKGVASRYWQWELTNMNGSDFEMESMELYPVVLTRKVTER